MQFGVCLPTFRYGAEPTVEHILAIAREAETLGYDSVWVSDHVVVPVEMRRMRFMADPFATLGVAAGLTRRVLLGTSVVVGPLRNALVLAKQAATLDYLSGGRLLLGLGAGWLEREFEYLNVDFHRRGRLLDETLRVLRAVWGGNPSRFEGEFYRFDDAWLEPQPARPGGPPLLIGGNSPAALRRAALLGDGWHADDLAAEDVARFGATVRESAAAAGRTVQVSTRVTTRVLGVADRDAQAPTRAEGYFRGLEGWTGIVGRADELVPQVRAFQEAGSSHFIAQFEHATVDEHLASLRVFARAVIPRVRGATSA